MFPCRLLRRPSVVPEVCWEKTGEALNLLKPQWNTSSSFDLMGSVLLGCLLTSRCMTDIWGQSESTR